MPVYVPFGAVPQRLVPDGILQDALESFGERIRIAIRKRLAAGADRLGQTTAVRAHDNAPGCDPLQRHDTKGFFPAGRHHEHAMLVQQPYEILADALAGESDSRAEAA